jgi:hypothetical protein
VVVRDFDIMGVTSGPSEADPPLVIDANAVLPASISRQPLQPVPWGNAQVMKRLRRVQKQKLSVCPALQIGR